MLNESQIIWKGKICMTYEIKRILECSDLIDLANYLTQVIEMSNRLRKNTYYRELHEALPEPYKSCVLHEWAYYGRKYFVMDDNTGTARYTQVFWNYSARSYKHNSKCLSMLVERIHNKMAIPEGKRLSSDDIHFIMDSLERDVKYISRVLDQYILNVILLNHIQRDFANSMNFAQGVNNESYAIIMVAYINNGFEESPHEVFLHELGHVLHGRLTGSLDIPPAGFKEFYSECGVTFTTDEDLQEVFAIFFSVAMQIISPNLRQHGYLLQRCNIKTKYPATTDGITICLENGLLDLIRITLYFAQLLQSLD